MALDGDVLICNLNRDPCMHPSFSQGVEAQAIQDFWDTLRLYQYVYTGTLERIPPK